MKTLKITIIAAAVMLAAAMASAELFKLVPVADTQLEGRSPDLYNSNSGSRVNFWLGRAGGGDDLVRDILQFDLSAVQDLGWQATGDATLHLRCVNAMGGIGGKDISVYLMPDENTLWEELQATWINKRKAAPTEAWYGGGHDWGIGSPVASIVASGNVADIAVPRATINQWLADDADGLISLLIRSDQAEAGTGLAHTYFHSKEAYSDPEDARTPLLSFNAVPEPGSALLLAAALVLALPLVRGRRRC